MTDAHLPIHVRELGWEPVAKAPQDGSVIWLCNDEVARVGSWKDDAWADFEGRAFTFTPTHWKTRST